MNKDEFVKEVKKLGLVLSEVQISQLSKYYLMLVEWNKVMNLTGITEEKDVYLKHFYDSLTIIKAIDLNDESTLCDIGTGAGFPGLVLKICFPHLKVTLVDALQKRLDFLKVVVEELNLKNVDCIHSRAEDYAKNNREKFDVVTTRAVATIRILIEYCLPLIRVNKYFIAMKGSISQEMTDLDNTLNKIGGRVLKIISFSLPVEDSQRNIVVLTKNFPTSQNFPRKYTDIKNKPL